MGSRALPLPGSPENSVVITREEGHSCSQSCWVTGRVSVGCWGRGMEEAALGLGLCRAGSGEQG